LRRLLFLLAVLITLIAPLLALPVSAQTTTTPSPTAVGNYVTARDIYVRGGPGEFYLPVGRLVAGAEVRPFNISADGLWVLIRYSRGFGWIRRDLADWADDIDNLPQLDESNLTPTSLATDTPTPRPTGVQIAAGEAGAYVRFGPGVNYPYLGAVVSGEHVDPVGRNLEGDWILIRFRDGFGWVSRALLARNAPLNDLPVLLTGALTPSATLPASLTPTASDTPTLTQTPSQTPTATLIPTNTPIGSGTSSATETLTPSETLTPLPTNTLTGTATLTPSLTATLEPTLTDTSTSTASVVPTLRITLVPTETSTETATSTATNTFTPMPTHTSTNTPSAVPSETEAEEATSVVSVLQAPTQRPSATLTRTASPTSTQTPTSTATNTATRLPSETLTSAPSDTPTEAVTETATAAPSATVEAIEAATETRTPRSTIAVTQTEISSRETATSAPRAEATERVVLPAETETITPSATLPVRTTVTAEVTPEPNASQAETATATATRTPPVGIILPTPVSSLPESTPSTPTIPPEALVGGLVLLALIVYVGLYWRGLSMADHYADGFVIQRCPVCQQGQLSVETRLNRVLGIPRPRSIVRCDTCRSVLREAGRHRWRYAVDPLENPPFYKRFNGKIVYEATLTALEGTMPSEASPVHPPTKPPVFLDDEE
jgi:uncharacterized protein YgiM (DUF1202 family)